MCNSLGQKFADFLRRNSSTRLGVADAFISGSESCLVFIIDGRHGFLEVEFLRLRHATMIVPIGNVCNGIEPVRLQRVSSRFIKLQQNLEPNHIRPKPYLQLPNTKCKSLRQRAARHRGRVFRQSPRKIAVWTSDGNIANIVRRNRQAGFAFVAFKRNRANLFQPHHDLALEGHVGEVYHDARARLTFTRVFSWALYSHSATPRFRGTAFRPCGAIVAAGALVLRQQHC